MSLDLARFGVVMGDLNCLPEDEPIQFLTEIRELTHLVPQGSGWTFNDFDPDHDGGMIDHILVTGLVKVREVFVDRSLVDGRLASDHYPVVARLLL